MASYGTVMIGKLGEGVSVEDWLRGLEEWKKERQVPGFHGEYTLVGDDERTLVSCVVFESKALYQQLADDPEQDRWWTEKVVPLLDGEPQWIDGHWAE